MATGVFGVGDRVQLTDPKGRHHTLTLEAGRQFHTHKGSLEHDDLIGEPEGIVITSSGNTSYLALRPLLSDFVLSMPRGATVVYPKDAAHIVGLADIFPGASVVEAGAGSAALTCSLLRAIGEHGRLVSYERRPDFAAIAAQNVEKFFGGPHPAWTLVVGDIGEEELPTGVDRVVLDLLAPWDLVEHVGAAMTPGGVFCSYVATTTQLARTVETLREHTGFTEPYACESLVRTWHVEGLSVRPDHRMVGHTGFLVTSRRLAPGVTAPLRRRRPAPGAYGPDWEPPTPRRDVTASTPVPSPAAGSVDDEDEAPTGGENRADTR